MNSTFQAIRNKGLQEEAMISQQPLTLYTRQKRMDIPNDATWAPGDLSKASPELANKDTVLRAIADNDLSTQRSISALFYRTSGIYYRLLRYLAFLYRYDWMVVPYFKDQFTKEKKDNESQTDNKPTKVLKAFTEMLEKLDNFGVKKTFGEIALTVLKLGCYYGYRIQTADEIALQELPLEYCRSQYKIKNKPVVEFNMQYFDKVFHNAIERDRMLNIFPKEFREGYKLLKAGKLKSPTNNPKDDGWYILDPKYAVKFSLTDDDYPAFISVIPLILDLDAAQDLDRKKSMQELMKLIVQQIPLDNQNNPIFDLEEEVPIIHNNTVQMLSGRTIGTNVLTTVADVKVEDVSDRGAVVKNDPLAKAERQLYNEAGVSQMQFNTNGNLALEKSVLNDEATMYNLLLQFETFLNDIVSDTSNLGKNVRLRAQMLATTAYNYKEMSKIYKEQTQLGYSKMLPQLALGQSQSGILANAYFENEILNLVEVFIPPMSSNTMSANSLSGKDKKEDLKKSAAAGPASKKPLIGEEKKAGRPEKPADQKSEKTILNNESAS